MQGLVSSNTALQSSSAICSHSLSQIFAHIIHHYCLGCPASLFTVVSYVLYLRCSYDLILCHFSLQVFTKSLRLVPLKAPHSFSILFRISPRILTFKMQLCNPSNLQDLFHNSNQLVKCQHFQGATWELDPIGLPCPIPSSDPGP